jgi:hypothetical protein
MDSKYFVTDDTALAAYLYLCGLKFVEATIWSDDRFRKKYVILDDPKRVTMEEDFYLRRTTVAPMDYHDARVRVSRFLKREIRDPRFEDI